MALPCLALSCPVLALPCLALLNFTVIVDMYLYCCCVAGPRPAPQPAKAAKAVGAAERAAAPHQSSVYHRQDVAALILSRESVEGYEVPYMLTQDVSQWLCSPSSSFPSSFPSRPLLWPYVAQVGGHPTRLRRASRAVHRNPHPLAVCVLLE
ncbi:hypothetical protein GGR56DRAFT_94486 [Xylariaceae sp. FL0804]|nr:hypothetical protein GGR56DRAFT_94486 [Xylariaceae sp. FL0804]